MRFLPYMTLKLVSQTFGYLCLLLLGYCFLDYAMHNAVLCSSHDILHRYSMQLIKYGPILLNLAFLFALIHTLTMSARHQEFLAMRTAGCASRTFFQPIFLFALLLTIATGLHFQWIEPLRAKYGKDFKQTIDKDKPQMQKLMDGSLLFFHHQDAKGYYDVYWITENCEMWVMDRLEKQNPPLGSGVYHIRPDPNNNRPEFFPKMALPYLNLRPASKVSPTALLPLSTLIKKSDKVAAIYLGHKLAITFLPLALFFFLAPRCLKMRKRSSFFILYAVATTLFISYLLLLNSLTVFSHAIPLFPIFTFAIPFLAPIALSVVSWKRL